MMQADRVAALALGLAAFALLLLAGVLLARLATARRSERTLAHALDQRAQQSAALAATSAGARGADAVSSAAANAKKSSPASGMKVLVERFAHTGIRWLDTPFGRQLVADEDRRLLVVHPEDEVSKHPGGCAAIRGPGAFAPGHALFDLV